MVLVGFVCFLVSEVELRASVYASQVFYSSTVPPDSYHFYVFLHARHNIFTHLFTYLFCVECVHVCVFVSVQVHLCIRVHMSEYAYGAREEPRVLFLRSLPSCSFKTVFLTDLSLNDWAKGFKCGSSFQPFRKVFEPAFVQTLKWTLTLRPQHLLQCFCFGFFFLKMIFLASYQ